MPNIQPVGPLRSNKNNWTQPQTLPLIDNGGEVYNVKAFGAKGDGVTDDTAAIQAAIEKARTATTLGGTVFIPVGEYICKSYVLVHNGQNSNLGVTLLGDPSWGSVLKFPGNPNLVSTASLISNTVTLTFPSAHGFPVNQNISVKGMTNTVYNGNYTIASVPSPTTLTYLLTHANIAQSSETGWVNQQVVQASLTSNVVTLTFAQPHGFTNGQRAFISGMNNYIYNGTYQITVASPTTITFPYTNANVAPTTEVGTVENVQGIRMEDATYCSVKDLYLIGSMNTPFGLNISSFTEEVSIEHVLCQGFYNGLAVGGDTIFDVAEVRINNCHLTGNYSGIIIGNGHQANALDIFFYGCRSGNNQIGVTIAGGACVWLGGTTISNTISDFYMTSMPGGNILVKGVRSEESGRFWWAVNNNNFAYPVSLEGCQAYNIEDSGGVAVMHSTSNPLYMKNCLFHTANNNAIPAVINLGWSNSWPLRCVILNTSTANSNPFVFNPSKSAVDLTAIGIYQFDTSTILNPSAAISLYNKYIDGILSVNGTLLNQSVVSYSSTPVFIASQNSYFQITLTGNVSSSTISGGQSNQIITIEWIQDATGSRTYVWPTNCRFAGGSAPAGSTSANAHDTVSFKYNGTVWIEISRSINVPGT